MSLRRQSTGSPYVWMPACLSEVQPWHHLVTSYLHCSWSVRPDWKRSIAESLANIVHPVPASVVLPGTTCSAIDASMLEPFDPGADHIFELYIDGATGPAHAGWAVAIVAKMGQEPEASRRLVGVTGGTVTLDPQHPQWVGATKPDNIAAEFTALLAAQAIILQQETHSQFCIRPDLSLSRSLSQQLHTTSAHPVLAQLCTLIAAWNAPQTSFEEVRGHTMNPWNDLADALAKVLHHIPSNLSVSTFALLIYMLLLWNRTTWHGTRLCKKKLPSKLASTPRYEQTVVQFPAFDPPTFRCSDLPPADPMPVLIDIRIAAINVLALEHTEQHHEVGRRQGSRTARIDAQFHAAGFHALGVQEARTASGRFQSEHYHILASGGLGHASGTARM